MAGNGAEGVILCLVVDMVDWRKRQRRGDCSLKVKPDKMHVNNFPNCLDFGILRPELDNGNRHFWKAYRIHSASMWKPRMFNIQLPCVGHQLP